MTEGVMVLISMIGRERELGRVAQLLDGVSQRGGALLVDGAAGSGKSALLADAVARAQEHSGMTVLCVAGVQGESEVQFAALHQLVRPVLSLAESLPAPLCAVLRAVFDADGDPL